MEFGTILKSDLFHGTIKLNKCYYYYLHHFGQQSQGGYQGKFLAVCEQTDVLRIARASPTFCCFPSQRNCSRSSPSTPLACSHSRYISDLQGTFWFIQTYKNKFRMYSSGYTTAGITSKKKTALLCCSRTEYKYMRALTMFQECFRLNG